jgi:hypothetical protein
VTRTTFTRRARPDERELAELLRTGTRWYDPNDHEVSAEDRLRDVHRTDEEVQRLLRRYLRRNTTLELTILRGHLVLEYPLNQFIRFMAPVEADPERLRLSFAQKIELFHVLGAIPDPQLFMTLELWNRLRNQLAHRLEFDRALVDRVIRINSEEEVGSLTDRQRASSLRAIAGFFSGAIMSGIHVLTVLRAHDPAK